MPPLRWFQLLLGLSAAPFLLQACRAAGPAELPVRTSAPELADFTSARVESLAHFRQLAAAPSPGTTIAGAKFVITSFSEPARRRIHYLDGRYYRFHDEWAWFRLFNGQPVASMKRLEPRPFRAPEDARRWATAHEDELPDGLELNDGRLYAREFYELSSTEHARELGAGSLIHVEARAGRPELWGFEVDYTARLTLEELGVFFEQVEASMPPLARGGLRWFARSPEQLELGRQLQERDPRRKGRVLTYDEISVPGETAVYTAGIVAGRLRAMSELSRLADAEPEDILLLGALPEYLPQARGLITAIPQAPLAHLNLLAKSRQIVNLYRGGVLGDPSIQDLVRSRAPVVMAAENGQLRVVRLTEGQYQAWQQLQRSDPPRVESVELEHAPYVVDLSRISREALAKLRPLLGGKAAGMAALVQSLGPGTKLNGAGSLRVDVPDRPLAITIRAYREQLAPFLPALRELLADENFLKFKKLRCLALEGAAEFKRRFPSKKDRELAESYENPQALGPIAAMVRSGGVVSSLRHAPLGKELEVELTRVLSRHFAAYSPDQGLRFRSSSTVEDIEGFNGAGLYDSATGYLEPRKATSSQSKRTSVADALRKTWASYFGFEAFEERHQNQIDHLGADMAVLVHARFDDALELANGVFTFALSSGVAELSVDAQPGAVSVTNPPTDRVEIPESTNVRKALGRLAIERGSTSSLAKPGQPIIEDAELLELFRIAEQLTRDQLARDNAGVPEAQQRRALVLDFEFRRVAAGWPALAQGRKPSRWVIKQMRPLEPSPHVGPELRAAPIPRDVLSRARRIDTLACHGAGLKLRALRVFTNPDVAPDLGYARRPLLAGLGVELPGVAPRVYTHVEQRSASVAERDLDVQLRSGFALSSVDLRGSTATLGFSNGKQQSFAVACEVSVDYAEPRELLRSFLAAAPAK